MACAVLVATPGSARVMAVTDLAGPNVLAISTLQLRPLTISGMTVSLRIRSGRAADKEKASPDV
ncbi:hypothetical protein DBR42_23055 [Pelomonas sp. HMWF004]|nr:hypothetical protein DBR42_23055 [Pelomonas sp. HMWF004]